MHHLFRLRHLLILAVVLGVGLVPLYANQQSLGAGANFAVLADDLDTGGGTLTVHAVANAGAGNVGANTYTPDTTNIAAAGAIEGAGSAAVTSALTDAADAAAALVTQAQSINDDPTGGTGVLDTLNLNAGTYYIPGNATLDSAQTLTLTGPGTFVIVVAGTLNFGSTATVSLVNVEPANVLWVSAGLTAADANLFGTFLSTADVSLDGTTVTGKVLAINGADIVVTNLVAVYDGGAAPTLAITGVTGEAPDANADDVDPNDDGTAADPYVVTEGSVLTFSVTATDPDGASVALTSDAGALPGYSEAPNAPMPGLASTLVTYAPPLNGPQSGSTVTITYTAEDASGAIDTREVVIFVNQLPEASVSAVSGQAPLATGTGTAGNPYVVCEGETFSFEVTGTDPDGDGGPTTLSASVSPATANVSFDPALPLTDGDDDVTTSVMFNTDETNAGNTYTITFTVTDDNGEETQQDVVIFVTSLPEFGAPFIDGGGQAITACVGQPVQYDLSAVDPDGEILSLYVDGTPVGAAHNPNALGADVVGPGGADLLNPGSDIDGDGNDSSATVRFSWLPTPVDLGPHVLTYTAVDVYGCPQFTTVTIIVTNPPTVSATAGAPIADGGEVVVQPGDLLSVNLTAADVNGDEVQLSVSGAPGTADFNPPVPVTGLGLATSTLEYTPTVGEAGQTFAVTVTATDLSSVPSVTDPSIQQCDASAQLTFTIRVANVPVLTVAGTGNTTVEAGNVINVCSGDTVTFRVRATDADAGDSITLTETGAPSFETLTPGLPAVGNPVETNFAWTAGAAGTTVINFTATDSNGYETTTSVTINVSAVPTITVSGVSGEQGGTGTEADPYVVCVGANPPLTFTVTGADSDVADLVTLTQSGAPAGLDFSTALPAAGNPVATTVTFSPEASQGGQHYAVTFTATDNSAAGCNASTTVHIRVTSLPVITSTASVIDVCEGEDIEFRIRATDAEPGPVTIGVPSIVSSDNSEGAPTLNLVSTPTLPTAGNPVETVVTATAPQVEVDTTFTITYTATDSDGCTATQVVLVNVQATKPTTVSLSQEPGGTIQVDQEVCFVAVVTDNCAQGPRPVAGVPVNFKAIGTTGNQTDGPGVHVVTDENGVARFCITPLYPGTLTVTAAIDANFDGIADTDTVAATSNITVPAPVQPGVGQYASGRGKVEVAGGTFGDLPVPATFNFDISPKRNGTFKGKVNVTVPGAGVGRRGHIKLQSRKIESMLCAEGPLGRTAVIFGTAKVTGHPDVKGTVRFRVDALDAGTPGVPNDRFTVTLLTPTGDVLSGPFGGNLAFGTGKKASRDDIKIRIGTRTP